MPLKCLLSGNPVFAFDFAADSWETLKSENRKLKHLSMPCCSAKATPKTSKFGTQFFAHARADGCAVPTETAEHILAKAVVAEAAKRAGWNVDTEVSGRTPEGEQWIADVLATKGQAQVPIEVQWSRQSQEETKRRQEKFRQSGLRGLWLLRHPELVVEKETPTFRLRYDEATCRFTVMIPSPQFDADWVRYRDKDGAGYWQQEIDLSEFIVGALSGALKFAPAVGRRLPLTISTAEVKCWNCKQETRIVLGLEFDAGKVLPGLASISAELYDFDNLDGGGVVLAAAFPTELLRQHGIGAIKNRYSRTERNSYLSNGCFHCDALQGRFFDHEYWYEAKPTYTVEVELTHRLAAQLEDNEREIFCWWFDESVCAKSVAYNE